MLFFTYVYSVLCRVAVCVAKSAGNVRKEMLIQYVKTRVSN